MVVFEGLASFNFGGVLRSAKVLLATIVSIFSLFLVFFVFVFYFYDNFIGYYKFRGYCNGEAGVRIFARIEPNKGWEAGGKSSAKALAALRGVGFARYVDEQTKEEYDVIYLSGSVQRDSSFQIRPADARMSVAYTLRFVNQRLDNEIRLSKVGYEVVDVGRGSIVAHFYNFGYSLFDVDHTFLGAPSGVECFSDWAGYMPEIQKTIDM
ncbi:hypothetical protein [Ralstonia solanacearum]|uniref:hypothetical protein n=1 Tax=Ralstonia solanacearum TaxID=305 RepID=UPI0012DAC3E2|nr:hypothetical protein [Ralstonia solanacearum]